MCDEPKEGGRSPWGAIQHVTPIIDGVCFVSTASHGGVKLDRRRNAAIPSYMRRAGGWYEEDCDYSIPFVVFADEIPEENRAKADAKRTLAAWHPDEYERFFGETLKPGESYMKDERQFRNDHGHHWLGIAASGSWHATVPDGMVGVFAVLGGRDKHGQYSGRPARSLLVPDAEYANRSNFGWWTDDPDKYETWNEQA
jgi:hypothetical protein